jgi:hypothetical protein
MICGLGWVTTKTKRDHPRNTDLEIQPREEMAQALRALTSAMRRPDEFISLVFRSRERIWVERCESLVKRS